MQRFVPPVSNRASFVRATWKRGVGFKCHEYRAREPVDGGADPRLLSMDRMQEVFFGLSEEERRRFGHTLHKVFPDMHLQFLVGKDV